MTAPRIPNLFKIPELKEKILFTLLCLLLYRIGAHITVPGVDVNALTQFFRQQGGGLLGMYDMFVGGGLSRATVFALGIMPYISASIFWQLMGAVFPAVEKLQREEEGRKKITQWTRYLTVGLAAGQAWGIAIFIEGVVQGAVAAPGWGFRMTTAFVLTVGGVFVMWLGEQITERGLGNGMSLLIFFSIVQGGWPAIGKTAEYLRTGAVDWPRLIVLAAIMLVVVWVTVAITVAARRIPIQIPRKVMGRGRIREGQKSFIPLRINSAGVMPIVFAQSIIIVPGTLAQFSNVQALKDLSEYFQPGSWVYYVLYTVLIVFFTYFYTAIIFNPVDLAENLKKQGGFIPGVKPGSRTAEYIDHVLSRVTLPGALFLTAIAVMPIVIFDAFNVPFRFGGTALLIVVGVALDTVQQMQQHMILRQYDGFMKEGRVRFRGRQRYM
ncbi:MAG TPA: preprotein translocase subunit SecY [Gemmatimonadales bacterium]|nr:preprotein translocase subunit SecY [Gemmatimonadales bacterium]